MILSISFSCPGSSLRFPRSGVVYLQIPCGARDIKDFLRCPPSILPWDLAIPSNFQDSLVMRPEWKISDFSDRRSDCEQINFGLNAQRRPCEFAEARYWALHRFQIPPS